MAARKLPPQTPKQAKARDSAVRKIEAKEAKQDAKTGKRGEPVRSTGRTMREGDIGSA